MPVCKLCRLNFNKLTNSHIISEWCYSRAYDSKHRFIVITHDNFNKLKISQKGIREHLLCNTCETKFSEWEKILKEDFDDISNEKSNHLIIRRLNDEIIHVKGINYDFFKKAILSILWRMSITSHSLFKAYYLGRYEEVLRKILYNDINILEDDFPIIIQKMKGQYFNDPLGLHEKPFRYNGTLIVQHFIIYGFRILIVVTKAKLPATLNFFALKQNGEIFITNPDSAKLGMDLSILSRYSDRDVRKFYKY